MHCVAVRNGGDTPDSREQLKRYQMHRSIDLTLAQWRRRLMPTDVRQAKFNNY